MKTEQDPIPTPEEEEAKQRHLKEAGGGLVGAIGGAGLGVLAGPPGMAAGAVIGAVVGTLTSWAMDSGGTTASAADEALDKEIGVDGGDIGVASLQHPPAQRGAISAAAAGSAGASAEDTISAEGPIAAPPDGD
jgi:hypothetical protein